MLCTNITEERVCQISGLIKFVSLQKDEKNIIYGIVPQRQK